jgi:hypothetical protein
MTDHERIAFGELLEPAAQFISAGYREGAVERRYGKKRIAAVYHRPAQRRKRRTDAARAQDLRGQDRSITVGMAERPHQAVVV